MGYTLLFIRHGCCPFFRNTSPLLRLYSDLAGKSSPVLQRVYERFLRPIENFPKSPLLSDVFNDRLDVLYYNLVEYKKILCSKQPQWFLLLSLFFSFSRSKGSKREFLGLLGPIHYFNPGSVGRREVRGQLKYYGA